jgi:ADP-ribose pyrophosphatase
VNVIMSELEDVPVSLPVNASTTVYAGAVWNVQSESFVIGDETLIREFVDHPGAVAILALDERDRVCLIAQYRHPIRAREWELPAGLLDFVGESPLAAAKRELAEETDLVASAWNVLVDFHTSPGGSNEALRVFLARGISDADEIFVRSGEESEIEKRWVPLDQVVEAVLASDVQNSILMVAVLAAAAGKARGWSTLTPEDAPWLRHPLSA